MQGAYWARKEQASSKRALEESTLIAPTWLLSPALSAKRIFSVCPSFSGPPIIFTGFWTAQSATISCRASNPMDSSGSHFSNLEQGRFTRSDGPCERLTTSKDYAFDCNDRIL